jgi:uncharacterized protein (DUF305 family)
MKSTAIALAFAASLLPLATLAEDTGMGMNAPHPGMMMNEPQAAGEGGVMPMMQGMQGMGPGMMMNCPMMGAMPGMGGMATSGPTGDQSVTSLALNAVNEKMHRDMAITFTGNVDVDFVRGMIAHHQGAIDMAKVVKAFGSDGQIRELAGAIIEAQEAEIATMRAWLSEHAPQYPQEAAATPSGAAAALARLR